MSKNKSPERPGLAKLIEAAKQWLEKASEEEKAEMWRRQRESWARQDRD